tara:strand:+ start:340 stop:1257 length:918 start_codon:yes stop_codon:yes gene_type:complete
MNNSSKSVLISGTSGFVGSAIYSKFLENNWQICTLGRNKKYDVFCDFSKPLEMLKLKLPLKKFDICIHIAAANEVICMQNPVQAYNINCCGTHALAEICKFYKIKNFFYISTFHVFGNQTGYLDEKSKPIPNNLYGLSHQICEQDLLMSDMNNYFKTKIIRLPNIIGVPHSWHDFDRWTLAQFDFCKQCNEVQNIALNSSGEQVRNWVNLEFVSEKILDYAENLNYEKIHHIVGQNLSVIQLAKMIAETWELNFKQKINISIPLNSHELKVKNDRNFSTENMENKSTNLKIDNFVSKVGLYLKRS